MSFSPIDGHDVRLVANAHPADWKNPVPAGRYNLVAIGGGTAGIIAALGGALVGGKTALVEDRLLGGDCLNFGCVPSKALLRSARAAHEVRNAARFGIQMDGPSKGDFAAVMDRVRSLRAGISRHDSAERFRNLGVDVFLGRAKFVARDALEVGGQTLRFARCVIATGASPAIPDIPGLRETGFLTNETVFSLTSLPSRLAVMGGGPIGCELAQAFRRLGIDVHLVGSREQLLPKDEPEAGQMLAAQFAREGIRMHLGWKTSRCERSPAGKSLILARGEERITIQVDEILVAVGRNPNVNDLGLEQAGVAYSSHGVQVDDWLRTSNHAIYAAGDVIGKAQFTHAADAMARICVYNALFLGRQRYSRMSIPRCTYTDPEIASIGLTAQQANELSRPPRTVRIDLKEVDRALLDGAEEGFVVLHADAKGKKLLGGTIVAPHAGEMIGELSLLMSAGLPVSALSKAIHCYPTLSQALNKGADRFRSARLTPRVAKWTERWLRWRR